MVSINILDNFSEKNNWRSGRSETWTGVPLGECVTFEFVRDNNNNDADDNNNDDDDNNNDNDDNNNDDDDNDNNNNWRTYETIKLDLEYSYWVKGLKV